MAHAHLRFENDCVASLNAARTSFQAQRTMQVVTDRGYVGIDFGGSVARLVQPSADVLRRQVDVHGLSLSEREQLRQNLFTEVLPLKEIQVEKRNAILDEQNDFVRCILGGHSPRVTGQQARDCLAVAERILQSIAAKSDRAMRYAAPARQRTGHQSPQAAAAAATAGRRHTPTNSGSERGSVEQSYSRVLDLAPEWVEADVVEVAVEFRGLEQIVVSALGLELSFVEQVNAIRPAECG